MVDSVTAVDSKVTAHVKSVSDNVDYARKQLKAASFVLHGCERKAAKRKIARSEKLCHAKAFYWKRSLLGNSNGCL